MRPLDEQLRPRRARVHVARSTRSATTSTTTAASSSPKGVNDAQVNDTGIDAALDTVKNSVDFKVIKDAMAEFQKIYVEKTVEIPLYYRKNVDLRQRRRPATSSATRPRPARPGTPSTGT